MSEKSEPARRFCWATSIHEPDSNTPNDHIDWMFAKRLDVVRTDYRVTADSHHQVVIAEFHLRDETE